MPRFALVEPRTLSSPCAGTNARFVCRYRQTLLGREGRPAELGDDTDVNEHELPPDPDLDDLPRELAEREGPLV